MAGTFKVILLALLLFGGDDSSREVPGLVGVSGPSNLDPPKLIDAASQLAEFGSPGPPVRVVLRVVVDEKGQVFAVDVRDLQPVDAGPAKEFASRLWESAWGWRFRPATRAGVPVKSYLDFTFAPTGGGKLQASPSSAEAVVPVLEARGTNVVGITHPALETTWTLHVPESVGTTDAFYMDDRPVPVEWTHHDDGSIGYTWTSESPRVPSLHGLPYLTGLRVSAWLEPGPDRIDVRVELHNGTGHRLERLISAGGCFQPTCQILGSVRWSCADSRSISLEQLTGSFIDGSATRTFIRTQDGLSRVSETHHTHEARSLYLFDAAMYDRPIISSMEEFWGRSETRPTSAFIAASDASGTAAVGIGFERAPSVSHSGPPQQCMHSGIDFGDLAPGQSVERRGVVLFGRSAEELFERFERLGYRPLLDE